MGADHGHPARLRCHRSVYLIDMLEIEAVQPEHERNIFLTFHARAIHT